jgi:hypothetical protein
MDEDNRKNEIVKSVTEFTCSAVNTGELYASVEKYDKIPFSKISSFGVAFEPVTAAFKNVVYGQGGSGLYFVNAKGGSLVRFANGSGYTGAISRGNNQIGGGMSILNPISFDPTMLFMAAALMSIDKKLDGIKELQKEIIEFLEQKEKSKLRGNLIFLTEVLNNYKHNWSNENYKAAIIIKVLDIKQESEQSIMFYRDRIGKKAKTQSLFHSDKDVKGKLNKIQSDFEEYQFSLYLYSFTAFLEVMLLENFEPEYLEGVVNKISDYAFNYREFYTQVFEHIEDSSKSSVQSLLLRGLASANKVVGDTVSKIPVVSNSRIDETLIETSSRIGNFGSRRTEQMMRDFTDNKNSDVYLFVESIKKINRLYNQPLELLFDNENIYLNLS